MDTEKFYLEIPSIERKQDAINYIKEFHEYNSKINGTGGLDRYIDDYKGWLDKLEEDYKMIPNEEKVPARTYFLIRANDNKIIGMINIRLALNEKLRRGSGNIGYSIRPTERGKGYNKINLYLGLIIANEYNIEKVLLEADKDNPASWKTMEALGGVKIREEYKEEYGCIVKYYEIDTKESIRNNSEYKKYAMVNKKEYEMLTGPIPISKDNLGIERIEEKCIKCGVCSKVCQEKVGIKYNKDKAPNPVCLSCGQCASKCPTGAIIPKYCYKEVTNYIKDNDKVVVAFTSPAVRVALGEEFISNDVNVEGKMVASLKKLGFNYVFDTTFGADLTIMEEASELVSRIKEGKTLPQFTSCCPAWVKYLEIYHPKLLNHLSTCKSPIGMQGAIIKNYFSEMIGISKENIIAVAITPCTAKKEEIKLPKSNDTDFVVTTQELALMIKDAEIDFNSLEDMEFDSIMARGSGAGVIFGNSGGVMEAAVRTAYYLITGENPPKDLLEFNPVRGYDSVKEATITINNIEINLLIVHGMTNIEDILDELEQGKCKYQFIEVMNCPGGCVGGGGQPKGMIPKQKEIIENRISGLYKEDSNLAIRLSHQNPEVEELYNNYLEHPLSHKSEELLHTTYYDRSDMLGK